MRLLLATLLCAPALATEPEEGPPAEETAEAPPPSPQDLAIEALRQELAALKGTVEDQAEQLDAQGEQIADQDEALARQRKSLAEQRLKWAAKDMTFEITGYYRTRGHIFGGGQADEEAQRQVGGELYEGQPTDGQYLTQRLRLGVKASYKDVASLNVHFQALDDVVWGDNAQLASTPLFAADPSRTRIDGSEAPPFEVFRAWTEFRIPVGLIRVGRQASHWGLGILANDGDGFRNSFGEAKHGNTFDRFLFATQPIAIAQAITAKEETRKIPLVFAVAFDKLVTDPLAQYYGYKCSEGIDREVDPDRYDPRCDLDGDGVSDVDRDYSEDRDPSRRGEGWWADQKDDVSEMVYVLVYRGEDMKMGDSYGHLTAGAYFIHRWQKETDLEVLILDAYVDFGLKGWILQFEGLGIFGKTRGIELASSRDEDDPLFKTARIGSYVGRLGYGKADWKLVFEAGYASGDEQVNDPLFTGRPMHPDYNVGLLLYEEIIDTVTRVQWTDTASGLWSQGGVYNSHYIFPTFTGTPMNNTDITLGLLVAFPDRPDGAVFLCDDRDAERYDCVSSGERLSDVLGVEVDLGIKHTFHEHIKVAVELGYAYASNRLPLQSVGLNNEGHFWTMQARAAWEF